MPDFMNKHADYININNFQTEQLAGDVSLLLGVEELYLHPKIVIQFSNGPAIAIIRQPIQSNKFLILAGPTRNAASLQQAEVEVEKDIIEKINVLTHTEFTQEQFETHNTHCVHQNHSSNHTNKADIPKEQEHDDQNGIESDLEEADYSDESEPESEEPNEEEYADAVRTEQVRTTSAIPQVNNPDSPEEKKTIKLKR